MDDYKAKPISINDVVEAKLRAQKGDNGVWQPPFLILSIAEDIVQEADGTIALKVADVYFPMPSIDRGNTVDAMYGIGPRLGFPKFVEKADPLKQGNKFRRKREWDNTAKRYKDVELPPKWDIYDRVTRKATPANGYGDANRVDVKLEAIFNKVVGEYRKRIRRYKDNTADGGYRDIPGWTSEFTRTVMFNGLEVEARVDHQSYVATSGIKLDRAANLIEPMIRADEADEII